MGVRQQMREANRTKVCVCVSLSVPQVALVYPNSDPAMFWVAFYGCLLAEVIPVPIEVPLSRQVRTAVPTTSAMSQCSNPMSKHPSGGSAASAVCRMY